VTFLKIGTLDDPSVYGGAQMAIFTAEGQPFHLIADGVPPLKACRCANSSNQPAARTMVRRVDRCNTGRASGTHGLPCALRRPNTITD
jgi:hypothetical protein